MVPQFFQRLKPGSERITAITEWRNSPAPVDNSRRRRAMIKKVKGGYQVTSEKGKNLGGPYKSKEEAKKRLRQVEYFKHKG
jgi:hypothetical protein